MSEQCQPLSRLSANPSASVIIFCGGKGARMGEITLSAQKCMHPWQGQPLLAAVLDNLHRVLPGPANVILATGHRSEQVRHAVGARHRDLVIHYSDDEYRRGTWSALAKAASLIEAPFLCLDGNVLAPPNVLQSVLSDASVADESCFGVIAASPRRHIAPTHATFHIRERIVRDYRYPGEDATLPKYCDMGIACYTSRFLERIGRYPGGDLDIEACVSEIVSEGGLFHASEFPGDWMHFAYSKDFNRSDPWQP